MSSSGRPQSPRGGSVRDESGGREPPRRDPRARPLRHVRLVRPDGLFVAILGAVAVVCAAFSHGAYYPTAWGLFTIVAVWVIAARVVLGEVRLSPFEVAAVVGLAALAGWIAASSIWGIPERAILEAERTALYVSVLAAACVVLTRRALPALLTGVWAAVSVACGYGLLTRLVPERLGVFDPIGGSRLSEPLGYWNGLGVFAALGALLAVGLAARASTRSGPHRRRGFAASARHDALLHLQPGRVDRARGWTACCDRPRRAPPPARDDRARAGAGRGRRTRRRVQISGAERVRRLAGGRSPRRASIGARRWRSHGAVRARRVRPAARWSDGRRSIHGFGEDTQSVSLPRASWRYSSSSCGSGARRHSSHGRTKPSPPRLQRFTSG